MSLSSRIDVNMTTTRISGPSKVRMSRGKRLVHAAVTSSARPRREAAGVRGAHRHPDLLERAPVVRRALVAEEPAAVRLLEREVHLQPSPVGAAGIGPAALVAVDAEPGPEIRWVVRAPPRSVCDVPPTPLQPPQPPERASGERASGKRARDVRRRAAAHDRQPVPRTAAEAPDVAPPGGCRPQFPARGSRLGLGRGDRGAGAWRGAWTAFAVL